MSVGSSRPNGSSGRGALIRLLGWHWLLCRSGRLHTMLTTEVNATMPGTSDNKEVSPDAPLNLPSNRRHPRHRPHHRQWSPSSPPQPPPSHCSLLPGPCDCSEHGRTNGAAARCAHSEPQGLRQLQVGRSAAEMGNPHDGCHCCRVRNVFLHDAAWHWDRPKFELHRALPDPAPARERWASAWCMHIPPPPPLSPFATSLPPPPP